jgi:hypothetical protein
MLKQSVLVYLLCHKSSISECLFAWIQHSLFCDRTRASDAVHALFKAKDTLYVDKCYHADRKIKMKSSNLATIIDIRRKQLNFYVRTN